MMTVDRLIEDVAQDAYDLCATGPGSDPESIALELGWAMGEPPPEALAAVARRWAVEALLDPQVVERAREAVEAGARGDDLLDAVEQTLLQWLEGVRAEWVRLERAHDPTP